MQSETNGLMEADGRFLCSQCYEEYLVEVGKAGDDFPEHKKCEGQILKDQTTASDVEKNQRVAKANSAREYGWMVAEPRSQGQ